MYTNKLSLALTALSLMFTIFCFAGGKTVSVSCSENDAQIYQDGQLVGNGKATIKVMKNSYTTVVSKKVGFFDCTEVIYNDKTHPKTPKMVTMNMKKDDAFEASVSSDVANTDFDLKSDITEEKAWKIISEIISSGFDVIEVTDKSSGYIRTSWVVNSIGKSTIRTRVIVRICNSDIGSCYKVKIVSEIAEGNNVSAKDDEKFKAWDRVLKKYNGMIPELQSRLK